MRGIQKATGQSLHDRDYCTLRVKLSRLVTQTEESMSDDPTFLAHSGSLSRPELDYLPLCVDALRFRGKPEDLERWTFSNYRTS